MSFFLNYIFLKFNKPTLFKKNDHEPSIQFNYRHNRNTPLVKINNLTADLPAEIYFKCEFFNPLASVKDRIGRAMIEAAEKDGNLRQRRHRANFWEHRDRSGFRLCRQRLSFNFDHA